MFENSTTFFNLYKIITTLGGYALQTQGKQPYSHKADGSFITSTDIYIHDQLTQFLSQNYPNIPLVCEENPIQPALPLSDYIVIDPLDGTESYVKNGKFFSVNVAFIQNHYPVAGIVYFPKLDLYYYVFNGEAFKVVAGVKTQLFKTVLQSRSLRIVSNGRSKSHPIFQTVIQKLEAQGFTVESIKNVPTSLKYFMVAEGGFDMAISACGIREWDIAVSDAMLKTLGFCIKNLQIGENLDYGKTEGFFRPTFIISNCEINL